MGNIGFSKIAIEWLNSIMKKENIFIQHAENIGEKELTLNNKRIININSNTLQGKI